jgi:CBS domain-containing protein
LANHVVAALTERGLKATPSVLEASLSEVVTIETAQVSGVGEEEPPRMTPDGGLAVGLVLSSFMADDRPLASVQTQETLTQARTRMRMDGYSQLPILSGKSLRGAITWESMAEAIASGSTATSTVMEAAIQVQGHPADQHLLEVIEEISAIGFVVVLGSDIPVPVGVVTYADVADAFVDLAAPFALIGDIDRRLRRVLDEAMDWDFLQEILKREDARTPENVDELGFGNYVTAFATSEVWEQLGWWLDQKTFVARLDELRIIRNQVTHFNPDPPSPDDVGKLRLFNDLLVELTSS